MDSPRLVVSKVLHIRQERRTREPIHHCRTENHCKPTLVEQDETRKRRYPRFLTGLRLVARARVLVCGRAERPLESPGSGEASQERSGPGIMDGALGLARTP